MAPADFLDFSALSITGHLEYSLTYAVDVDNNGLGFLTPDIIADLSCHLGTVRE